MGGLPEADDEGEDGEAAGRAAPDLDWDVPLLFEEEGGGPGRRPFGGRRPQDRRSAGTGGPRRGAAARQARKDRIQARLAPPAPAPASRARRRRR